jgi:hypothetical protein
MISDVRRLGVALLAARAEGPYRPLSPCALFGTTERIADVRTFNLRLFLVAHNVKRFFDSRKP